MLLPAAAFALHQLRYTLGYGSRANSVLAAQGHSYLNSMAPWLVLLVALGAGSLLVRASHARVTGETRSPRRSNSGPLALASACLPAISAGLEIPAGCFYLGQP